MELKGYATNVAEDEQIAALCEMIEIDMGYANSMTPIQQLMLALAGNAYSVHKANKLNGANSELLQQAQAKLASMNQAAPIQQQPAPVQEKSQAQYHFEAPVNMAQSRCPVSQETDIMFSNTYRGRGAPAL